ncbi:MAG: hypothetical protein KC501_38775, partial [Myxococcales bacterium]|nr:hypothetical protein [Myxococcales bacterium]
MRPRSPLSETIPRARIELAAELGACRSAIRWLLEQPRSWAALRRDREGDLRWALERRDLVPEDVLRALAGDESYYVRGAVAENAQAPEDVLRALAGDESSYVRGAVAENAQAPEDVL